MKIIQNEYYISAYCVYKHLTGTVTSLLCRVNGLEMKQSLAQRSGRSFTAMIRREKCGQQRL